MCLGQVHSHSSSVLGNENNSDVSESAARKLNIPGKGKSQRCFTAISKR